MAAGTPRDSNGRGHSGLGVLARAPGGEAGDGLGGDMADGALGHGGRARGDGVDLGGGKG